MLLIRLTLCAGLRFPWLLRTTFAWPFAGVVASALSCGMARSPVLLTRHPGALVLALHLQ